MSLKRALKGYVAPIPQYAAPHKTCWTCEPLGSMQRCRESAVEEWTHSFQCLQTRMLTVVSRGGRYSRIISSSSVVPSTAREAALLRNDVLSSSYEISLHNRRAIVCRREEYRREFCRWEFCPREFCRRAVCREEVDRQEVRRREVCSRQGGLGPVAARDYARLNAAK